MKTLKLIVIVIALFLTNNIQAQVSVNINIGSAPQWGPVGYSGVRYYYLPDVEAYYDVNTSMFIYFGGGKWIHRKNLPYRYRNYDLYNGYKVVLTDYRGNAPYAFYKQHKVKYAKGYRGHPQKSIGMKPGKGNYNPNVKSKGNSKSNANGNSNKNNSKK